ncbi:NAD(P)H-hydrate dehydratase [Paenibacillus kyungheensis]|uniref:Bifunctional NAD(P)H-hydrate repair enzyme n=1 Tax=Paenibacillus kyungheensis TaxID=1452732 RepID=A0AAX3M3D2_9BACL|nr:NAD(P)H-hydrate dehydratase [Paenibacillus kyungheensis]WCT56356.1 NAD(P)H-hydrate dehydratase [Paenibacillus kyungheensis]
MYIVTAQEMRDLDQHTIQKLGIPALSLMESAGKAIAEEVIHWNNNSKQEQADIPFGKSLSKVGQIRNDYTWNVQNHKQHWLILVGKGNNGGDGLVVARYLQDAGIQVTVLYAQDPAELTGDAATQRDAAQYSGIVSDIWSEQWETESRWQGYTGIVDALLGTGSQGEPRAPYDAIIHAANCSGKPIIAADIPSGLNADTGEVADTCIQASLSVSLAFLKRGLVQYPGAGVAGDVVVRNIGIPRFTAQKLAVDTHLVTEQVLEDILEVDPERARAVDGHKGTYGHVLIIGGSMNMSGAGLLASRAALRIGSGLVTWALPQALLPHIAGHVPELMLAPAVEGAEGKWEYKSATSILTLAEKCDVLAIGPGLGRFEQDGAWLQTLWEQTEQPLVLDADGLNMIAEADGLSTWQQRKADTVLTPHPGEMARLAGISTPEVQRDRIGIAREFAMKHHITLVLKGARTVIASPEGQVFVNTTGHPGMATGGSGDALTGIIVGLLAQGLSGIQAATFGVHLHGHAGEVAAYQRTGNPASLLAGDLIESL